MKNNTTPQNNLLFHYLKIPLEVAQDKEISDGAKLLFAEIYGLQCAYGQCFASDTRFMMRRGKGRTTIQRQITELWRRGHIQRPKHQKKRRFLCVDERYLGGSNDPIKSENETEKTPESETKNQEKRTTLSPSSRVVPQIQLSPDEENQVEAVIRALDDATNAIGYRSLFVQTSERGRIDAWRIAFESTLKAKKKSGHMEEVPIAYFRTVLKANWKLDPTFLQEKAKRQTETANKLPSASVSTPPQPVCGDFSSERNNATVSAPVGDEKSLLPFPSPQTADPPHKNADQSYEQVIASLPDGAREEIIAQAEKRVRQKNLGTGFRKSSERIYKRLLVREIKQILIEKID